MVYILHVRSGRRVKMPLNGILRQLVFDMFSIPGLYGSLQLGACANKVCSVVRVDVCRFATSRNLASDGHDAGVSVQRMSDFDMHGTRSGAAGTQHGLLEGRPSRAVELWNVLLCI